MTKIKELQKHLFTTDTDIITRHLSNIRRKRRHLDLDRRMGVNTPSYNILASLVSKVNSSSLGAKSVRHENLKITLNRLMELLTLEEDEEEAIVRPTQYAFNTAFRTVLYVYKALRDKFPKASVSVDSAGEITLRWYRPEIEAKVGFVCSPIPEEKNYIYYTKGEEFNIVENVTSQTLVKWIEWLNNA